VLPETFLSSTRVGDGSGGQQHGHDVSSPLQAVERGDRRPRAGLRQHRGSPLRLVKTVVVAYDAEGV